MVPRVVPTIVFFKRFSPKIVFKIRFGEKIIKTHTLSRNTKIRLEPDWVDEKIRLLPKVRLEPDWVDEKIRLLPKI